MTRRINRMLTTGLAGLVGCLIGAHYERWRTIHQDGFITSSHAATVSGSPSSARPVPLPSVEPNVFDHRLITQHGMVDLPSTEGLRIFRNFVLSYDRRTRNANWVFEHLSADHLPVYKKGGGDVRPDRKDIEFFEDASIHQYFRSTNKDYLRSGYDRGHLAAAGNHKLSKEDLNQTFVLSNISPQVGLGFNRGIWNKLEKYVRYRAKAAHGVWVCTGPCFLPQQGKDGRNYVIYEVIGNQNVAVPTHFFKVLLVENRNGEFELESYLMANRKQMDETLPLQAFQVPLESIERASGLLFFDKFPKTRLKSINGPNKFLSKFDSSSKPSV